jgi:hypothetical protein
MSPPSTASTGPARIRLRPALRGRVMVRRALLLALALLPLALVLVGVTAPRDERLRAEGRAAEATIVDRRVHRPVSARGKRREDHELVYEYVVDGRTLRREELVEPAEYAVLRVGDRIAIRHLPDRPEVARRQAALDRPSPRSPGLYSYVGSAVGAVFLGLLVLAARLLWPAGPGAERERRLLAAGEPAEGRVDAVEADGAWRWSIELDGRTVWAERAAGPAPGVAGAAFPALLRRDRRGAVVEAGRPEDFRHYERVEPSA